MTNTNIKTELAKNIIEEIRKSDLDVKILIGSFVIFYNEDGKEKEVIGLNPLEIPEGLENLEGVIADYVQENLNNVEREMKLHKEYRKIDKIAVDLQTFLNDEDGWCLQDVSVEEKRLYELASKLDNYLIDFYRELVIEKEEY